MTERSDDLRRGDRLELDLTDFSYLGEAVAHAGTLVLFVAGGIAGERALIEIVERRHRYARGRVVEVIQPSPDRQAPPCPYFGTCGGCQLQHAAYTTQLGWKTEVIRRQLQRIGGFEHPPVQSIIPTAEPFNYRNHARFSINREGLLSFTHAGSHDLLPIEQCLLMQSPIVAAMPRLQGVGIGTHQIAVRCSTRTRQILLSPAVTLAEGTADTIRVGDDDYQIQYQHYDELFLGRRFRVSPSSFFQVNTRPTDRVVPTTIGDLGPFAREGAYSQAEILALLVLDRLAPSEGELIADAYCGVGVFALLAADRGAHVLGIEEAASAIADARINAGDLLNVEFQIGRSEQRLAEMEARPDAVVLDPSRIGCAPAVLEALLRLRPTRIVYVSCDPATLARDLKILAEGSYRLEDVQPIDMFPQTHHIEAVATLSAANS